MYLKEIVINGFKSFADRTRIALRPGITAIVGPNGCGKSNIVDAIRWVLGEQSAKALRGGSMHDVIFAGTDSRKPLQFCEVELVFDECEQELGTAFHEVSVVRRVSRDDASDYFLNGKACRLKDIQRLFMDTGIGRVSYSFMVQGQIDQILSANPAERRSLFEEAAGITRYKSRRKETLSRLALVDQNLARVTDVLEEIARRLASLKRQAAKALRWRRTQHRLRCLDLASQAFRFTARNAAISELEARAGTLRSDVEAQQNALREREEKLASAKVDRAELFQKIETETQAAFALSSQKEGAEAQAQTAELRRNDLRERIEQIAQEKSSLEARRAELEARRDNNASGKNARAGDVEGADEAYRARRAELEKFLAELAALERDVARERQSVLQSESELARSRSLVTNIEVELRTSESRRAEIADALAQTQNERHALEARLAEIQLAAESCRTKRSRALRDVEESQENSKTLLAQFRAQQQKIMQLDRTVARTAAQIALLEQQQAKFEGFSAGAKAILRGELGELVPAGTAFALSSILKIPDADDAAALEALLGAGADALVLDAEFSGNADEAAAKLAAISRELTERRLGSSVIAAGTPIFPAAQDASPAVPAFLKPAKTLFSVKNEAVAPAVNALFDRCFVCDFLDDFFNFLSENPTFDFFAVATPNGETVDCRGFVRAGTTDADKHGIFLRQNEIARLRERLTTENEALNDANAEAMKIQAASDENDAEIERRRAAASALAQEISEIGADERAAVKALNDNAEASANRKAQLDELEENRRRAAERMTGASAGLSSKESALEAARERISAGEAKISELRPQAESRRNALEEERFALAQKRQELELFEHELAEVRAQITALDAQIDAREREKTAAFTQIDALDAQATAAKKRAEALAETLAEASKILTARRAELARIEAENEAFEKTLGAEREALRENSAKLSALDVQLTEQKSQRKFIAEKVLTEYRLNVADLAWKQIFLEADSEPETQTRFAELDDDSDANIPEKTVSEKTVPEHAAGAMDEPSRAMNEPSRALAGTTERAAVTPPKPLPRERREPTPEELAALDRLDWAPILREISALRERLAAMGAVNHTAIEEYAALRERHDFLKAQSDDLWNAKNELVAAIDELNATSQRLFSETFEKIRKNFKFTFQRLFRGGESDLQLIQSDDVLESGIEIIARPPGTKLRSISLLSGGQRTMTAVALLFGIYMVKPSPFCVLDELDAPLDDANVGRFTEIVRDFTRFSQFLVVTHNKRTVSAAATIYGATMQERGVTKLLSMRYSDVPANAGDASANDSGEIGDAVAGTRGKFDMAR